jgi:WD40 repeat protein
VWKLQYSPDGSRFASCSGDKTIRLWNPGTGACVGVLEGHRGVVTDIAWGGKDQLASCSWCVSLMHACTNLVSAELAGPTQSNSSRCLSLAWMVLPENELSPLE